MDSNFEIVSKCRRAIQEGDNKLALEFLKGEYSNLPSDVRELVDMLLNRFHRIQKQVHLGVVNGEEWRMEDTRISLSILSIINELGSETSRDSRIQEKISIEFLTDKYSGLKILLEEESEENENQQNTKEVMEQIEQYLSSFAPELKDLFENFHEKLFTQVRDENVFRIQPKRVFVFGETNAGKTTTINNLLKSNIFKVELFPASDKYNLTQTLNCGEHDGGLVFYDSPGIGDDEAAENITRAALNMRQKGDEKTDNIILIDVSKNLNEGGNTFKVVKESEIVKFLNKEAYEKYKKEIAGKEFQIEDFQKWSDSKFDFYVFVISGGLSKGINSKQTKFLKEFFETAGKGKKVFKIINILNDRKSSRFKKNFEDLDSDIKFVYEEGVRIFEENNLPEPREWIFVESNFNKGFEEVIKSMIKSLNPEILISIEKAIKTDFSYLIQEKIDSYYFKYVAFIASMVGCHPVDHWIAEKNDTLLSYSMKSIIFASSYFYQTSNHIKPEALDKLIKNIKKDKKDYKTVYSYKNVPETKSVYVGTGLLIPDWWRENIQGISNYKEVTETKKVSSSYDKEYYHIGGNSAIIKTLAVGITLYSLSRGTETLNNDKFKKKIDTLSAQIEKDFPRLDLPEYLRKNKYKDSRANKVNEIRPFIGDYLHKYIKR